MKIRLKWGDGLAILSLVIGLLLLSYPTVSNVINDRNSSKVIARYETVLENMDDEEYRKEESRVIEHNELIARQGFLAAAIDMEKRDSYKTYHDLLNLADDHLMGIIQIPKLHLKLPIYHTADQDVISRAIGHYPGSSLPIGGKDTHAVLTGHRGLPSATLFSDLDQLREGDLFYLEVLDRVLAYKVVMMKTIPPDNVDDLQIIQNKDLVTLLTCTPYGVNTHRLIVRGERVPYHPEQDIDQDGVISSYFYSSSFKQLLHLLVFMLMSILLAKVCVYKRRNRKK